MTAPGNPQPQSPSKRHENNAATTTSKPTNIKPMEKKTSAKAAGIVLGAGPGPIDSKTVRSKVMNWQTGGGGVVVAPEAVSPEKEAVKPLKIVRPNAVSQPSTPKGTRDKATAQEVPEEEVRVQSMGKPRHNPLTDEVREASSPKKRVVSDGHWRKNRSPPKEGKPIGWVRPAVRPKVKVPEQAESEDQGERRVISHTPENIANELNAVRKRRQSAAVKTGIEAFKTGGSDKAKSTPEPEGPGPEESDKDTPTRRRRRRRRSPPLDKEEEANKSKTSLTEDEPLERNTPRQLQKPLDSQRPKKEKVESSSPSGGAVFPARVEAWLTTTPDPFVDSENRSRKSSQVPSSVTTSSLVSTSAVSSITQTTLSTTSFTDVSSDIDIGGTEGILVARPKSSGRASSDGVGRNTITKKSLGDVPRLTARSTSETDDHTPAALRRMGARRGTQSPIKSRANSMHLAETIPEDDSVVSSTPSSSVEGSMFDTAGPASRQRKPLSRRAFPTTGKRLSTIASVETLNTNHHRMPPSIAEGSEIGAGSINDDAQSAITVRSRRSIKHRNVSHADLMSVLSLPRSKSKSLVSAHSIRTSRSRLETATVDDLMKELAMDEEKYRRELNTLVDGVIPVLLACVLSKSDAAVAAGLFNNSTSPQDPNCTKPIVDMGVALERLKTLHKRLSTQDTNAILSWAQSAERIYTDYIKCWRLGFQNVVVNLAPAAETGSPRTKTLDPLSKVNKNAWDEGLPRNTEGYVVNDEGERVDVAFLLKRPLVRLKWLAKTLKGINMHKPSEKAENMATIFQNLVNDARKRNNEERARMEDEAAASIDSTRARDPKSLLAIQGVSIEQSRCVKARDIFDMHLLHSSGQEIDCRVELFLRDDRPENGTSGDVLICDFDATARWLFFPPIQIGRISARKGDSPGELVVMIRGFQSGGKEWQEVFALKSNDEEAALEWIEMLGDSPVPPPLAQISSAASFISRSSHLGSGYDSSQVSTAYTVSTNLTTPNRSRNPSPREMEVPIGEPVGTVSKRWSQATTPTKETEIMPLTPPSKERATKRREESPQSPRAENRVERSDGRQTPRARSDKNDAAEVESPGLRRARATRSSRSATSTPVASEPLSTLPEDRQRGDKRGSRNRAMTSEPTTPGSSSSKSYSVWYPPSDVNDDSDDDEGRGPETKRKPSKSRPDIHRRASSVPSLDLPNIPRLRENSSQPTSPDDRTDSSPLGTSASRSHKQSRDDEDTPPAPPPHRSPTSTRPASAQTKTGFHNNILTPVLSPLFRIKRRSSSPLKHEYEPSTASESSLSESETSLSESEDSISGGSSAEDSLEEDLGSPDISPPQPPRHMPKISPPRQLSRSSPPRELSRTSPPRELPRKSPPRELTRTSPPRQRHNISPPGSAGSLPETTLAPSNSASQVPYREIPAEANVVYKGIASIFTWMEEPGRIAQWEPLCKDNCSIVVKPGFIEVFDLSQAHTQPELNENVRPLLALGLTPNVLVHRGTHIDIDIRSPPLGLSLLKAGGRTMFRSPIPMASEELWQAVRWSRENNPTFLALQNARGAEQQPFSWAAQQDRLNAARPDTSAGKPRWSLPASLSRSRSYRASSTRGLSINSSVDSKSSFFSALKRFGGGGRFSVARSSLDYRSPSTVAVDMTGEASGSTVGSITPGDAPNVPLGVTYAKIRFHKRVIGGRWNDLGKARLHIMAPTQVSTSSPGDKRIVVATKAGQILLDATVPENGFEIYGKLGIAVKVVEDILGSDGAVGYASPTGGVGSKRLTVFMLQFKTNRQCKYNYLQLGKMRY